MRILLPAGWLDLQRFETSGALLGEVYSCGDDFCIKRWDINRLHEGSKTNFFGHTCNVTCITLSPKSQRAGSFPGFHISFVRHVNLDPFRQVDGYFEAVQKVFLDSCHQLIVPAF